MVQLDKVQEIVERGFAIVPRVLNEVQLQKLRSELISAIQQDEILLKSFPDGHVKKKDIWMVHNCMVRGPQLAALMEQSEMHLYLGHFLTNTCIVYAYQSSSMPAMGSNYSNRIHVDCPRFIPGYLTNMGVIFPLDDFSAENGATRFLPGSHLRPEQPSVGEFDRNSEQIRCKAGDMIVFNARTWHSGGVNQTHQPRHSLTINVCRSYMRQRFDFPRMIDSQAPYVLDWIGTEGRRFLGYNVRVPSSLDEFFLEGSQRLYLPGQG